MAKWTDGPVDATLKNEGREPCEKENRSLSMLEYMIGHDQQLPSLPKQCVKPNLTKPNLEDLYGSMSRGEHDHVCNTRTPLHYVGIHGSCGPVALAFLA